MNARTTLEYCRPFGGLKIGQDVPCTFKPIVGPSSGGSGGRAPVTGTMVYSHIIEVAGDVDLRDGLTRTAASNSLNYADGDEVRIPDSGGTVYVVVYVERVITQPGDPDIKRVYLLRDTAVWPGP